MFWEQELKERAKGGIEEESHREVLIAVPEVEKGNFSNCCHSSWADEKAVILTFAFSCEDNHYHTPDTSRFFCR